MTDTVTDTVTDIATDIATDIIAGTAPETTDVVPAETTSAEDKTESREFFSIVTREDGARYILTEDYEIQRVVRVGARLPAMDEGFPLSVILENYDSVLKVSANHTDDPAVTEFMEYIRSEYRTGQPEILERLAEGLVMFQDIPFAFPEGTEVLFPDDQDPIGAVVHSVQLATSWTGEPFWKITVEVIMAAHGEPQKAQHSGSIRYFSGLMRLSELGVKPLTTEAKAALEERGRIFRDLASGSHYTSYKGQVIRRSHWGDRMFQSEGRIVLDAATLKRIDPEYAREIHRIAGGRDEGAVKMQFQIPEDKLFMCWPFLYGFSLSAKVWGEFRVSDITPIKFRDDAFDKLVLPAKKKKLVRALVEHSGGGFSDIVEAKGGGCIFLLHGEPGQGKTLTAEAVAEVLHRPLYSVSVGELGTNPKELESSLRTILDVAQTWNAVLLLDEADIFLEARDEHDVHRNAMVGVFLRLLEYHQGVLFLTTNRVKNFDRAFHSRISIALHYPRMDGDTQLRIWRNLLDAAGIRNIDPALLDSTGINGRQIKNAIRLAQTLAKSEGVEVDMGHLEMTLNAAREFEEDLRSVPDWKAGQN